MILTHNKFVLLLSLLAMSACEHKPIFMRFGGDQIDSGHTPAFKQGWNDGCATGTAAYGSTFTKVVAPGYTRDATMVGNPAYESAWNDAYHWCRQSHNTNINNWDSDWYGLLSLE